ncbi:hypothetical protein SDC9_179058 [bioreactor metagenome]|uniref:Uncharacterized protein n=1 Tax=bioreactor metagenome TaxID=1076179 RepID=A0A645H5N1_9ZZZZ
MGDGQVVPLHEGTQPGGGLHQIGQMAEGVFKRLRRAVGHVGKCAEGRHIDEGPLVEPAHVAGVEHAGGGHPGRPLHVLGQAEILGKIVGGPGGDIAQGGRVFQGEQARHGLVEGAVAAAADDPVEPPAQMCGGPGGVRRTPGGPHRGEIARLGEHVQNAGQVQPDLALAGVGIIEKEQFLHGRFPRKN